MKETKFIEQNKEKWADFEQMFRENRRDPDKLNDLFVQITDDLSYARIAKLVTTSRYFSTTWSATGRRPSTGLTDGQPSGFPPSRK